MLKQMIPFMSPAAAKSLKIELKQIASQLASLGAEGGGNPGGLSTAAAVTVTDTAQAADRPGLPPKQLTQMSPEIRRKTTQHLKRQRLAHRSGVIAAGLRWKKDRIGSCRRLWKN